MSRSVLISVAVLVVGGATAVEGRKWDGRARWLQRGVPIRLRGSVTFRRSVSCKVRRIFIAVGCAVAVVFSFLAGFLVSGAAWFEPARESLLKWVNG